MSHSGMEDNQDSQGALVSGSFGPLNDVTGWLMAEALRTAPICEIIGGLAQKLVDRGVQIQRAHIGFRTLHPLYVAKTFSWIAGENTVTQGLLDEQNHNSSAWFDSPFYYLLQQTKPTLRVRLDNPEAIARFPIFEDFAKDGVTDYLAFKVVYSDGLDDKVGVDGVLGSWTTTNADGFSDEDLMVLRSIVAPLAVAVRVHAERDIARNIVSAYLGRQTGDRVLQGTIQRGAGDEIEGVIWFCDLRGSTALSETMSRADYLRLLNDFLEEMTEAVHAFGGEVLRFIGDAALAIFPVYAPPCSGFTSCPEKTHACNQALSAAKNAQSRIAALNQAREAKGHFAIRYGIGVHYGEFMYGNIGSPDRVEFTVIGTAPNVAARVQAMSKVLDRSIVVSEPVAKSTAFDLDHLGSHALLGVREPLELYAPADDVALS